MDETRTNAFISIIVELPLCFFMVWGLIDNRKFAKKCSAYLKKSDSSVGTIVMFSPGLVILLLISVLIFAWGQYRGIVEREKEYNAKHRPKKSGDEDEQERSGLEGEYRGDGGVV